MKLSPQNMLELLTFTRSDLPDLPDSLDFISLMQGKNFELASENSKKAPQYMREFWTIARAADYEESEILAWYAKQETEKPTKIGVIDTRPLTGGIVHDLQVPKATGSRFVLTSAQNNTDLNSEFFHNLRGYCGDTDSQLMISRYTYNKNGFQGSEKKDDDLHYDPQITPYISDQLLELAPGLIWCGDLNILPTAKNPLNGFQQYTGVDSAIIPHAAITLESIATPKSEAAKFLYSTGTVTQRNYISKKAGQTASARHCYGAAVVEVSENGAWHVRQIQADSTGGFYDLDKYYGGEDQPVGDYGLTMGDLHSEKMDLESLKAAISLSLDIGASHIFLHDLFDMSSRNHHNRKSGKFLKQTFDQGGSVEGDLLKTWNVLNDISRLGPTNATISVVESNHDLSLQLWLDDPSYSYRTDPENAETFLRLQLAEYLNCNDPEFNLLEYATTALIGRENLGCNFLTVDDSLVFNGVEQGYHGHIGANGSRGGPKQFAKLNRPMNTGHTHTAGIVPGGAMGGVYTAGVTGSLDMGYNKGPSSWSHSHIITYPNGMRTIITMKGDELKGYSYRA